MFGLVPTLCTYSVSKYLYFLWNVSRDYICEPLETTFLSNVFIPNNMAEVHVLNGLFTLRICVVL